MIKPILLLLLISIQCTPVSHKQTTEETNTAATNAIKTGADQTDKYLHLLQGKRIGILANQTTIIGSSHLVDSFQKLGIRVVKVFGPEHGFRGNASNGARVSDEVDSATGIPIVSLYGAKRKPSKEDLQGIDLMIFDIQDVGCRFYTNINTLADVMEACADHNKELLILDRPNPNGYLVDGPVLDMKLVSGIGRFPIPMAHGMTIGEFAHMINGQGWLPRGLKCNITVVPVANWHHDMAYTLPVKPSPNLNTQQSVMLYPSVCLFEGTYLNHGRGTYFPFTVFGSPQLKGKYDFNFKPVGIPGMSESPLFMNEICYGLDLRQYDTELLRKSGRVNLQWMMELYRAHPEKEKFFDSRLSRQMGNIDMLSGTTEFREQIKNGWTEEAIRKSWEPELSAYKEMRKKYMLYP